MERLDVRNQQVQRRRLMPMEMTMRRDMACPERQTRLDVDGVIAEIENTLRRSLAAPAGDGNDLADLSGLAEAVFLIGARFGIGWAEMAADAAPSAT